MSSLSSLSADGLTECSAQAIDILNQALTLGVNIDTRASNRAEALGLDAISRAADLCRRSSDTEIAKLAKHYWVILGYYGYQPSLAFGIFAVIAFSLTTLFHLFQTWQDWKKTRRWFTIVFLLGGFLEIFGWANRVVASSDVNDYNAFVSSLATLVIAPVFFSAAIYAFFGYCVQYKNPAVLPARFNAKKLSWTFIIVDFVTLMIQAVGGGLASSSNRDTSDLGSDIMLAGIILQLITMVVLAGFFVWTLQRAGVWRTLKFRSGHPDTKFSLFVVGMSVAILLVIYRGIYRTAELAQGFRGRIAETQGFLIAFDALPMLGVMLTFNICHPSRTFPADINFGRAEQKVNYDLEMSGQSTPNQKGTDGTSHVESAL